MYIRKYGNCALIIRFMNVQAEKHGEKKALKEKKKRKNKESEKMTEQEVSEFYFCDGQLDYKNSGENIR